MNTSFLIEIALYVSDLERSRQFYEMILGVSFQQESHLPCALHYALQFDQVLVELYKTTTRHPVTHVRIVFVVPSVRVVRDILEKNKIKYGISAGRVNFFDPDGNCVHIRENA